MNRIQEGELAYYHFSDKQMKWLDELLTQVITGDAKDSEKATAVDIYNLLFGGIEYDNR